jgi:hypothetical protein
MRRDRESDPMAAGGFTTLAVRGFEHRSPQESLFEMKTPKERADERRQEKLAQIEEQVEKGTLTIRKMTAKERAAHPPKPRTRGRRT